MKKAKYLIILTACTILVFAVSCDKEFNPSDSTKVEYQITPMNDYFTKITYTDGDGNEVIITDPSQFTNGTKTVFIKDKPFTAKFDTDFNNTSTTRVSYMLKILVNGKKVRSAAVQVGSGGTNPTVSLEFTIPE